MKSQKLQNSEYNASDIRLSIIVRIFREGFGKQIKLTVNTKAHYYNALDKTQRLPVASLLAVLVVIA